MHVYMYINLARHNFTIDATDVDASIKTCFVVRIYNVTPKGLISSSPTIVWPLLLFYFHKRKRKQKNQLHLHINKEIHT